MKEILPTPASVEVGQPPQETQEIQEAQEVREVPEAPETNESTESDAVAGEILSSTDPVVAPAPVAIVKKDRLTREVEAILEDDLTDLYLSMPADKQLLFRQKGEETLSKIRVLLSQTKLNAKKIFDLIAEWLKMIPGVNRFFLEQEAKIKTDKILLVTEEERKESL